MTVKSFDSANVGEYICIGNNSLGKNFQKVDVNIRLAPIVKMTPQKLELRDGEQASVKCEVESGGKFSIKWKLGNSYQKSDVRKS